jgi:putative CocE/NonD family hydrolase
MKEKYIFVYQDVRGRWMSEGEYTNMTPIVEHTGTNTDESTDTYDAVAWLLKNVAYNNRKVGQWGISYPGFYATNAAFDAHPAMKAVSPQAPIGDFFFDDFHHNGAYTLAYYSVNNLFGVQKTKPLDSAWYSFPNFGTPDMYQFYLDHTPLSKLDETFPIKDNFFWEEIKAHPNYDEFWKKRGIIQHLSDIKPAMMIVGGWYDAEDLYGPLMTYKTIEKRNPNTYNTIVMGPWSHGDWSRKRDRQSVSNVYFGDDINEQYQKDVEAIFFHHFLKGDGNGNTGLPDALMFDSGKKEWNEFPTWPPQNIKEKDYFLGVQDHFSDLFEWPETAYEEFVSDPKNPVPYRMNITPVFIPRKYMADDQRQNSRRPDVLVFETEVLKEDLTLAGPIKAELFVSTTGSDADWVVKLIDVYPGDHPNTEETQDHINMGHYQQLVRGEAFRGRFRESFENPKPFIPNEVTEVSWELQDVFHTFKKGHKLMIQIHSSWFPYIDMNPQTYVDNIFEAKEKDFQKQTHRVYHDENYPSKITVHIIPK